MTSLLALIKYTKLNEAWLVKNRFLQQNTRLSESVQPPYLPYASGCSLGLKRSVYEAVGELDESLTCAWDMDYCWRVQQAGTELHFVPKAVIHYRLRHRFLAMYHQARNWSHGNIALLKKYTLPEKHTDQLGKFKLLKRVVWHFLAVLQHLSSILKSRSKGDFAQWVWDLGFKMGTFEGNFKYLF